MPPRAPGPVASSPASLPLLLHHLMLLVLSGEARSEATGPALCRVLSGEAGSEATGPALCRVLSGEAGSEATGPVL